MTKRLHKKTEDAKLCVKRFHFLGYMPYGIMSKKFLGTGYDKHLGFKVLFLCQDGIE